MQLKCVIVDDSTLQRLPIAKLIKDHSSLDLVGEYSNALDTKKGLKDTEVDLIFLDVEMPILNGFELLDLLSTSANKPQVIFITGKTEYAYKAFNYDAVGYLKKPVSRELFNSTVDKAINNFLMKKNYAESDFEYIFIKSNLKKKKIFIKEIKWIEALGDYIKVVTFETSHIVLSTMKAFEQELPEGKFLRIHKSYIVNLAKIERFNSKAVEVDGSEIPLSRNKKGILADALEKLNQ
jgi:two-component system, LytTR family, response regulator